MTTPDLGALPIDLPKLLETRLLVQANSGGGKSWCVRRLLEQTAAHVQQLVIDVEGEFATLREKFDYIICAPHDGDAVATPATAAALARALWESGASAIVDIYDLPKHERTAFVRLFIESLITAPRAIWHQTLVLVDEIQLFAPQTGDAESLPAVIDLATRGRKRGLALVGATLRLGDLSKSVAAELNNKLIGRTLLDIDVARAAFDLGVTKPAARDMLRALEPGQFYASGPALGGAVQLTRIGPVTTTHLQSGQRLMGTPPPASKAILAKLQAIEGIQKRAAEEATTVEGLQAEVKRLRAELKDRPPTTVEIVPPGVVEAVGWLHAAASKLLAEVGTAKTPAAAAARTCEIAQGVPINKSASTTEPIEVPASMRPAVKRAADTVRAQHALRAGAVRILQELAARSPAGYSRAQVGALTQFAHKGGTFTTYLGDLRKGGLIEERAGLVYATEQGITHLGGRVPARPTTHAEVMQLWRKALRSGAHEMLKTVVEAGSKGMSRAQLAGAVGMTASGGTFTTYLGDLRRNALVHEHDKTLYASAILFPSLTTSSPNRLKGTSP